MAEPSNRAKSIFLAAIEDHAPDHWPTFLEQACAGDVPLRDEVEKLLQARREMGSFHEAPRLTGNPTPDESISEGPGATIGPFKLLERIGEGGFGVVFMAEQLQPVRRKVALKILKPGMDTHQVIARFEAERQALAIMDHPNIAHILDGGATASGRPYFVMELVRGIPITKFCDENRLPVRERLELFISVCHAVQHAHQKGIIHRDLKPTNVLVTMHDDKGVAKIIDFGIAKASGQQLTEKTLFTNFAQMIGTPVYMSPEQAQMSGLDVDTRSDIYALGVLLYELLTGTTPFEKERLKTMGYDEVCRVIREEEPPKPSTRISALARAGTIARQGKSDPRRLGQLFRSELDWIVMKCLEKDRTRRYETANGLAMDLMRYLADEPVLACPPSASYRLRKFAHKYRALLRIAALFFVFIVAAAAISTWQAVRATRERDRAEASFHMARDAVDRLFTQVSQSPKLKAHGMEKFRKDLLQNAQKFYERFVQEQFDSPSVRYDLGLAYHRLTDINYELGDYTAAEESSSKASAVLGDLAVAQPKVPEYQRDLAASYVGGGLAYFAKTGRWEEAEAAFEQALAIQQQQAEAYAKAAEYRYALAKTYRASGYMLHRADQPQRAARRYQQALDVLSKLVQDHPLPEHQSLLATTEMNLATVYLSDGWYDKAELFSKEAKRVHASLVRDQGDVVPEEWQALARSHAILGMAYRGQAQTDKAEEEARQAMKIFENLAKEHPDVQEYAYDVGRCYTELGLTGIRAGRPEAAITRFDKAIAILEGLIDRGLGAARNSLLLARIDRAIALAARGDHSQAGAEGEAVARQGDLTSAHYYDLACAFSQSSAVVDHDGKLLPAERARLKMRYADRAMDFLHQAITEGWSHLTVLKSDPDMGPLLARQDFQKLVADLEGKTKK
jgi:serine/threonine protein kinase/tetratricopeptide (TPR) repeat protein